MSHEDVRTGEIKINRLVKSKGRRQSRRCQGMSLEQVLSCSHLLHLRRMALSSNTKPKQPGRRDHAPRMPRADHLGYSNDDQIQKQKTDLMNWMTRGIKADFDGDSQSFELLCFML